MIKLAKISTGVPKEINKEKIEQKTIDLSKKIGELIEIMWAQKKHSLLVVFQGMDASGKDGAFKNVFQSVPHAAVTYKSYGKPTAEEFSHDFLWRIHKNAPAKGTVSASIRSHYEDILIQKVHGWIDNKRVGVRMDAINAYENLLQDDNGTVVLKFYMHISPETQIEKLTERIEKTEKNWKHKDGDWEERKLWDKYMEAYEYAINNSSIAWTIVPADERWYRDYIVAEKVYSVLKKLKPEYVKLPEDSPAFALISNVKSNALKLKFDVKEEPKKGGISKGVKSKSDKKVKTESKSSNNAKEDKKPKKEKSMSSKDHVVAEIKKMKKNSVQRSSKKVVNTTEAVTPSAKPIIKRGRKSKVVENTPMTASPVKRGRKPKTTEKVAVVETKSAEVKKARPTVKSEKSSAPANKGIKSNSVATATKRGRKPAQFQVVETTAPVKRGRPASASKTPAKRGRKPSILNQPTVKVAAKRGRKPNKKA